MHNSLQPTARIADRPYNCFIEALVYMAVAGHILNVVPSAEAHIPRTAYTPFPDIFHEARTCAQSLQFPHAVSLHSQQC